MVFFIQQNPSIQTEIIITVPLLQNKKVDHFQNSFNYRKAATDCNYSGLAAGLSVYLRIWRKAHKSAAESSNHTGHGIYT